MAAGIADHIWTCEEIAALLDQGRSALDSDPREATLASKGRFPMTKPTHPVDRRLLVRAGRSR
jgi:hypothetical protein